MHFSKLYIGGILIKAIELAAMLRPDLNTQHIMMLGCPKNFDPAIKSRLTNSCASEHTLKCWRCWNQELKEGDN